MQAGNRFMRNIPAMSGDQFSKTETQFTNSGLSDNSIGVHCTGVVVAIATLGSGPKLDS
jgi:hypothetical protein